MWKFMAFGIIVQTAIFISLLDVYVYEKETRHCPHIKKQCPKKVVMFVVEGLQIEDLNETLGSNCRLGSIIHDHHIHRVIDTPASFTVRPHRDNESVFGDRAILYVGPALDSEHFDTSHWKTVYIPELSQSVSGNYSAPVLSLNDSDQNYSTHISHYLLPMIHKADTKPYATILMRFPSPNQSVYLPQSDTRIQLLRSYLEEIYYIMHSPSIANENNIYVISSLIETFSHNTSYPGPRNDSVFVVWSKQCTLPNINSTLDYFGAFEWINYLLSKTDPSIDAQEEELQDVFPDFYVEGNLLDAFGFGRAESRKHQTAATVHLNSLEALNVMLYSMNYMEIEYEAVAMIGTMLLIIPWVLLLCIKAWKSIVPAVNIEEPTGDTSPQFLDAVCFAILAIVWVWGNYCNWEFRHFLYLFVSVILFRLFCGELMSFSYPTERISVSDKLKIAFQIILFGGIVESLFWATTCGKLLYILFVSTAAAKIFQGAFSTSNLKIVISLAVAALFVGVIYLCPVARLPYMVNLNITIFIWMLGGFFALKYMVDEPIHDRFLLFLCLIEFLMASIFANLFVFQNDTSLAIILSFFLFMSAVLPLLGGTNVKYRLIALSVTTASFFLFFSFHGEGLLLLALFTSCFCSFLMDKASSDRQKETLNYFCIFPVLFYTVIIITTCELIMPIGCSGLFQSSVLVGIGVPYDFMTFGLVYFIKLAFLLTLLGGTALSSCKKAMELPCFFLIIVILNLVSFRTYMQIMLLPGRLCRIGRTRMFIKHILMQTLATSMFYLYPFIQLMTKGSFFTLCQTMKNIGMEPVKQ